MGGIKICLTQVELFFIFSLSLTEGVATGHEIIISGWAHIKNFGISKIVEICQSIFLWWIFYR